MKGNNVLVVLEVGKDRDMKFNIVTSVYSKISDQIANWVSDGKLLYVNKRKAFGYLGTLALIASAVNNQKLYS